MVKFMDQRYENKISGLNRFISGKYFSLLAGVVIAFLTGWAWVNRFIVDDAFITYRYASNLAFGHGLVWNIGEAGVEGYTNFLWTLFMSVPFMFGISPEIVSLALGCVFFAGTLVSTYRATRLLYETRLYALITILLLGLNYSFYRYATGGLETQLHTFLFTLSAYLVVSTVKMQLFTTKRMLLISVILALSMLNRLDSALFVGICGMALVYYADKSSNTVKERNRLLLALILPVFTVILIWFGWKISFYGDILPNTFYVKVSSKTRGIYYVYTFFKSYILLPLLLALFYGMIKRFPQIKNGTLLLAVLVVAWLGYVVSVGGDYLEFRFIVPALPLFFILAINLGFPHLPKIAQVLLVIITLFGSWHHMENFGLKPDPHNIMPIRNNTISLEKVHYWREMGSALGKYFNYRQDVVIAVTYAGYIPYYSQLRTVDMFGLNDRFVPFNGLDFSEKPGHTKLASLGYLVKRGVNLAFGEVEVEYIDNNQRTEFDMNFLKKMLLIPKEGEAIPQDMQVVKIPISRYVQMIAVYLVKSPFVDKVIADNGWKTYPVKVGQ